jgi:hypothetical protein
VSLLITDRAYIECVEKRRDVGVEDVEEAEDRRRCEVEVECL